MYRFPKEEAQSPTYRRIQDRHNRWRHHGATHPQLNSALFERYHRVYSDGLNLKNVTVSTRQTDNFKFYCDNFGIRCHFDNELTAKEADFLIVATPATLDNWILADLKQPLLERIQESGNNRSTGLSSPTLAAKISI
jgi:hypothetical protein